MILPFHKNGLLFPSFPVGSRKMYIPAQNMHVATFDMFVGGRSLQLPEEGLGRNRADEPLEQFARSLPTVVNRRKVSKQHC